MDLEEPSLVWDGAIPRSSAFNDIYYSPENGLAESTYVFIQNNFLEKRFSELCENNFCIAETGFGTGLNFLATCQVWANENRQDKHLDFISFEKYPFKLEDLEKALHAFKEVAFFSEQLINNYPKRIKGFHRLHFSHNISLTLFFGDALEGLQKLHHTTYIDAWYFDGFSPKENESLWCDELFELSKKFNHSNTSFATFTCAGHVKRKLINAGFNCEKVKGYGIKREMLRGKFTEEKKLIPELSYSLKPWLRYPTINNAVRLKNVAIIGAGLAGAWTAHKLAKKGIQVDVYDSASEIASAASGNPRGATYFKLNKEVNTENNFYLDAYLYSIRELDKLQLEIEHLDNNQLANKIWDKSGLIQLTTEADVIENKFHINQKIAKYLSREECESTSGCKQSFPGIHFPDAGSVNPKALCKFLLNQKNIKVYLNCEVSQIHFNKKLHTWSIQSKSHVTNEIIEYSSIVIANSYCANNFEQCSELPLYQVRGQSTQITSTTQSKQLKTVICSKGYLTPSINGQHCIGSTFDPRNKSLTATETDNQTNLSYLKEYTPDFFSRLGNINISSAKAALRCQTPDMLPIVGALPDYQQFISDYADIAKGQLKKDYPLLKNLPNLYINTGHASRGLISAPYCAEILVNEMCADIIACEQDVSDNLAAARFYIRALKRMKA